MSEISKMAFRSKVIHDVRSETLFLKSQRIYVSSILFQLKLDLKWTRKPVQFRHCPYTVRKNYLIDKKREGASCT